MKIRVVGHISLAVFIATNVSVRAETSSDVRQNLEASVLPEIRKTVREQLPDAHFDLRMIQASQDGLREQAEQEHDDQMLEVAMRDFESEIFKENTAKNIVSAIGGTFFGLGLGFGTAEAQSDAIRAKARNAGQFVDRIQAYHFVDSLVEPHLEKLFRNLTVYEKIIRGSVQSQEGVFPSFQIAYDKPYLPEARSKIPFVMKEHASEISRSAVRNIMADAIWHRMRGLEHGLHSYSLDGVSVFEDLFELRGRSTIADIEGESAKVGTKTSMRYRLALKGSDLPAVDLDAYTMKIGFVETTQRPGKLLSAIQTFETQSTNTFKEIFNTLERKVRSELPVVSIEEGAKVFYTPPSGEANGGPLAFREYARNAAVKYAKGNPPAVVINFANHDLMNRYQSAYKVLDPAGMQAVDRAYSEAYSKAKERHGERLGSTYEQQYAENELEMRNRTRGAKIRGGIVGLAVVITVGLVLDYSLGESTILTEAPQSVNPFDPTGSFVPRGFIDTASNRVIRSIADKRRNDITACRADTSLSCVIPIFILDEVLEKVAGLHSDNDKLMKPHFLIEE